VAAAAQLLTYFFLGMNFEEAVLSLRMGTPTLAPL